MYGSPQNAVGNASDQRALKKLKSHGAKVKNFSWNNNCSIETKLKKGINSQYSQWRRLSAGICTAQGCPAYLYLFEMGNALFWSAASRHVQLETIHKDYRCDHSCERSPTKQPLPGLGFATPGKEIPKRAIKSGMSCRKNKGDNHLLFLTIQEVGDITVRKWLVAGSKENEESTFSHAKVEPKHNCAQNAFCWHMMLSATEAQGVEVLFRIKQKGVREDPPGTRAHGLSQAFRRQHFHDSPSVKSCTLDWANPIHSQLQQCKDLRGTIRNPRPSLLVSLSPCVWSEAMTFT